jgi:phosphoribosylformylglycinamidine synthase
VALAEACLGAPHPLGARVELPEDPLPEIILFGEAQSRAVVSLSPAKEAEFLQLVASLALPCRRLGHVQGLPRLHLRVGPKILDWSMEELHSAWEETIPRLMQGN